VDLSRIIPERFVRYQWQRPGTGPYDPLTSVIFPLSRRAWGTIGDFGEIVPTGAEIALVPLQLDGTRGVVTVWADWFQGLGGTNNFMSIALLATGDPIPPAFVLNPANAIAGRTFASEGGAASASQVAADIAAALGQMFIDAGVSSKFAQQGGQVLPNVVRADLGAGTIAIVSPAPWRPTQLQALSGVWGNIGPDAFEGHQGTYRPEFLAGCRPAPWLVVGNAWLGRGQDNGLIG
jgi:hypothetical protein